MEKENIGPEDAFRTHARFELERKIKGEEKYLDALRILFNIIPWDELSDEDEDILWNYFCC